MKASHIGILVLVAWMASPVLMLLAHWWSGSTPPFLHFYAFWCDSINGNVYAIYKAAISAAADSKPSLPPTAATFIGGAIVVSVGAALAYIVLFFIPNWIILFIARCVFE